MLCRVWSRIRYQTYLFFFSLHKYNMDLRASNDFPTMVKTWRRSPYKRAIVFAPTSDTFSSYSPRLFIQPYVIDFRKKTPARMCATACNLRWAFYFRPSETRSESSLHPALFHRNWMPHLTLRWTFQPVWEELKRPPLIVASIRRCFGIFEHPIQLKRREQTRTLEQRCWFEFVIRAYTSTRAHRHTYIRTR